MEEECGFACDDFNGVWKFAFFFERKGHFAKKNYPVAFVMP